MSARPRSGAVAILWHLHQPEYRDPETGRPVMPWTRLHALRGYRDLAVEVLARGEAVTLNVVPVLLDQLEDYARGAEDDHLALTRVPAVDLSAAHVAVLRRDFVAGHPSMISAWPAYAALAARVTGGAALAVDDLRDLQVWSTLAWFGATATRDLPEIDALRRQGRGFTEQDKAVMLAAQDRVLGEVPDLIARVARSGHAAVSTTPYHHPILPLVVDVQHARRNLASFPSDVRFAWPDDARRHLVRARERLAAHTGIAPVGLWPSEGSVSPEVVALAGEAGFRWLASDEEVLAKSVREGGQAPGGWDLGHGVVGFFRDRDLSDRIGFRYAAVPAAEAAEDLVSAAETRARGGVVTIVLDGENPWEAFADAGGAFRQALAARLDRASVRPITLDEAASRPPVGRVGHLHTGSWIGADFRIWAGHAEDHAAWRALAAAREAVEASPHREAALERLLPAEGSDWTWWYGDDFVTPFADVFDRAFRAHLRAAWVAAGRTPPADLDRPIRGRAAPDATAPVGLVAPRLDRVAWVHWAMSGVLRWPRGASMAGGSPPPEPVRHGWDRQGRLWVTIALGPDAGQGTWGITLGGDRADLAPGETEERAGWAAGHVRHALVVRVDDGGPAELVLWAPGHGGVARVPATGALHLPAANGPVTARWWSV